MNLLTIYTKKIRPELYCSFGYTCIVAVLTPDQNVTCAFE